MLKLHAIHTACGIETLAEIDEPDILIELHAIHTACGIETAVRRMDVTLREDCMQSIPLAVLKRQNWSILIRYTRHCMQSIPLAVLKR